MNRSPFPCSCKNPRCARYGVVASVLFTDRRTREGADTPLGHVERPAGVGAILHEVVRVRATRFTQAVFPRGLIMQLAQCSTISQDLRERGPIRPMRVRFNRSGSRAGRPRERKFSILRVPRVRRVIVTRRILVQHIRIARRFRAGFVQTRCRGDRVRHRAVAVQGIRSARLGRGLAIGLGVMVTGGRTAPCFDGRVGLRIGRSPTG